MLVIISGSTSVTFSTPTMAASRRMTLNVDLNNPAVRVDRYDRGALDVGRVNMADEKRETETIGGRFALTFGDDKLNVKVGGAYDEVSRDIRAVLANTQQWQNAVCGGNPSEFSAGTEFAAAVRRARHRRPTAYPRGLARHRLHRRISPPLTWGGSLIPKAAVPSYLRPGRTAS